MDSSSEAPLLLTRGSNKAEEYEEVEAGGKRRWRRLCCCRGEGWWREATEEARLLAALAAPMIAVALLQLTMQLISTVMVGHLGEVPLAGAAIANSLTNVSGFSVLIGLASGLETICGQAYGAELYHKLSLYTYRSIIVLLIVSVPIAILWVFIPEVLPLMGQEPQIASEAGKYALWLIPGLFAFSVAQCFSKFLQSQSLIFPMVLSSLITLTVFIPLCWFMVYKVGMGNTGAALSVSICDWVEVTVLGLYIKFSPSCEKTRAPLSWEAFSGLGSFMRLAVPSALMICLEWWSYELLVLLSGILPNPALETSVLSICISTVVLLYNLPYGIGTAASVRISNELGAGNPEGARLVVVVALSIIICSAVLVSTTLLALRRFVGIVRRPARPDHGAFIASLELLPPPQPPPPQAPHPLTGLCFAIADAFHISGYITSFGSLEWARTHDAATQTSLVVSTLVDGGAICVGKTVIDEMAYSIHGENKHFGTPTNPAAPDRLPGGCSSGSAVAVAGGMVDFALGIDSIGGVRLPGGYCGVLGFRPSHAVVLNSGVIPVAPSLDTIGWFARDPSVLRRVGHLLLRLPYADIRQPRHFYIADDCFELSKIPARRLTQVVTKSVEKLFGRQVLSRVNLENYLASRIPSLRNYSNGHKNGDSKFSSLLALSSAMQLLHKHEFKDHHMEWINSVKSTVDSCIVGTLSDDGDLTIDSCQDVRTEVRLALNVLLKDDGILVIPTALGCPPKLNARELSSASYNAQTLCLSSLSSMSGCCQVTVPLGTHDKCPISVSFIARHGGDRFLLDTTQTMYATIQEQVEILAKSNVSSKQAMNEEAAEAAKEKGNIAFKEKQWQKAINFYTEAIKLNGKVATYYSNRAAAFLELASYRQAEADCTSAIDIDPKSVKAYLRRGTAREMLGYYKEAVDDFSYALVLEPMNKTAGVATNRIKKLFP